MGAPSQKHLVSVVQRSSKISPASPSSKGHLFLSSLDIWWQDLHYNKRLIFYPTITPSHTNTNTILTTTTTTNTITNTTTTAFDDAIQTLKKSLSAVLVHYYPWAGRLALDSDGRLVIDCNDAGVEFTEASIDTPMSDISREGFPMMPLYEGLCPAVDHTGEHLYTSPLLAVQVTRFSDGGMSVGVTQSHVVADGQSLWNFMVSWGECARGHADITVPPIHERERLALQGPPSEEKAKKLVERVFWRSPEEEEEEEEKDHHREEEEKEEEVAKDGAAPQVVLTQCVFDVSASSIKKLKAEAGGSFTTYEVVCAHFWQRVNVARQSPPKTKIRFAVLTNLRTKLTPPLPASYFGNVIGFGLADTRAGTLRGEDLATIAARIHGAALDGGNPECLFESMHWLDLHGNRFVELWQGWFGLEQMNVASSPRFPAYKVDFGWGFPAAVRSSKVPGDGEMVLFGGRPGSGEGDMEICMALPSPVMKRLLDDPSFLAKPISSPFHYYD